MKSDLVPIAAYAKDHGVHVETVRRYIRGELLDVGRFGRNYVIQRNARFVRKVKGRPRNLS